MRLSAVIFRKGTQKGNKNKITTAFIINLFYQYNNNMYIMYITYSHMERRRRQRCRMGNKKKQTTESL